MNREIKSKNKDDICSKCKKILFIVWISNGWWNNFIIDKYYSYSGLYLCQNCKKKFARFYDEISAWGGIKEINITEFKKLKIELKKHTKNLIEKINKYEPPYYLKGK